MEAVLGYGACYWFNVEYISDYFQAHIVLISCKIFWKEKTARSEPSCKTVNLVITWTDKLLTMPNLLNAYILRLLCAKPIISCISCLASMYCVRQINPSYSPAGASKTPHGPRTLTFDEDPNSRSARLRSTPRSGWLGRRIPLLLYYHYPIVRPPPFFRPVTKFVLTLCI